MLGFIAGVMRPAGRWTYIRIRPTIVWNGQGWKMGGMRDLLEEQLSRKDAEKSKESGRKRPGKAETQDVATAPCGAPVTAGETEVPRSVAPGTAARHRMKR